MKKKDLINILLAVVTISLVIGGVYVENIEYTQALHIAAVVVGLWFVMRVFNIKPLTSRD